MEKEREKGWKSEVHSHPVLLFEKYLFTCSVIFLARFRIDRNVKHEYIDRDTLSLTIKRNDFLAATKI